VIKTCATGGALSLADVRQTEKAMFVMKGGVIHRHDSGAAR
jgi:hypothetical protein